MKNIVVILYQAEWCSHCKHFKPEWEKFRLICEKFNNYIKQTYGILLSCKQLDANKDMAEVENANVNGFPTIHIIDTDTKEINQYEEPRKMKNLLMNILNYSENNNKTEIEKDIEKWETLARVDTVLPIHMTGNSQAGGKAQNDNYSYYKYLKYKQKYVELIQNKNKNKNKNK
jgi:hypothetical protein